ncbi:IS4 family transposase [Sphingobacterium sp. ML3W]|uniref:IS4 family transposase n=1 Tax=Sphingobacterium sp. ML3W TaxID=1538644 RepID=UPI00068CEBEF|nr:IS4 family transposase [Sphingobacterium sp. ML3W]
MPLKKNSSLRAKDTDLLTLFKAHMSKDLHLARIRLVCLFVTALCKTKSVNFVKVSAGFDSASLASSCMRRIQRFMAEAELPMKLISSLIFSMLPVKGKLILVMDRTNWKFGSSNINILMLGVIYKGVAIPLLFKMLDKRGNSNTQERIDLMQNFIDWFGLDQIDCLLADREFVGDLWLNFLNLNNIRYHIRIRNNFKVFLPRKQSFIKASYLFNSIKVKQYQHYQHIVQLGGELCYLSATKSSAQGKIELLILVSFNKPDEALRYYKERWQVETLFKGMKSSGFNIEDTHVTALDRLEKLMMLTMLAFIWCYLIGDYIDREIKPITIKKHGRKAKSVFKYGLDYLAETLLSGYNKLDFCTIQNCHVLSILTHKF